MSEQDTVAGHLLEARLQPNEIIRAVERYMESLYPGFRIHSVVIARADEGKGPVYIDVKLGKEVDDE